MRQKSKNAVINIRTLSDRKHILEEAAGVLGQNLSSFMISSSLQKAEEVLATHGKVTLNNKERDRFIHSLSTFNLPKSFDKAVDKYNRVIEI